ncbi:MAG: polysaccharide deacetylase family protein [Synergistetes bacterium]|nr:polysaccharide deacetylase family protein [Synergistota bacterium]MDW8192864.1 polysaccharide deacetylase family protein [Synergistota bacterium]
MKAKALGIALLIFLFIRDAGSEVITRLPTYERVVALTFDACETKTPSYLDWKIVNFLIGEKIPFTLFVSGKFLERNMEEIRKVYKTGLMSLQNHSYLHVQNMERLSPDEIERDVKRNERLILEAVNKKPIYFRFPAGNYDERSLKVVESLGYRVIHWSFASGDPDRRITPEMLTSHVLKNTKPGSILIFHANGRGYSTGDALPMIVKELRLRGYRFVRLEDYIPPIFSVSHSCRL